jgi:hypothetical protein
MVDGLTLTPSKLMVMIVFALKPLPVTCTFVPGAPDTGAIVIACVMLKFTVTVLPEPSLTWNVCEPPGSLGTAKPVIEKDPAASVVAALALTTFPSIEMDTTEDATKPVPLTPMVVPPVNWAGLMVMLGVTVKVDVAVLPDVSDTVSV